MCDEMKDADRSEARIVCGIILYLTRIPVASRSDPTVAQKGNSPTDGSGDLHSLHMTVSFAVARVSWTRVWDLLDTTR